MSVITPTGNRAEYLKKALRYFRAQDYPLLEWLILDDSPEPSAEFEAAGPNIHYRHINQKLSIGEKRNRLIEHAKGAIIVHFDDDDYYAPTYITQMVRALEAQDLDLVNLQAWFLKDLRSQAFAYWDLTQKEGPHYRCDGGGVNLIVLGPDDNADFRDMHFGFGFSFVYRKTVWEAARFPDMNFNEDGVFSRQARSRFKVGGMNDTSGLVLHLLHEGSTSRCFPQQLLPDFLLPKLFPDIGAYQDPSCIAMSGTNTPSNENGLNETYASDSFKTILANILPIHVINLDRSPSRMEYFRTRNSQLSSVIRFSAVDGSLVDRDALIHTGTMLADCPYSNGTLGCALSHVELWRQSLRENKCITVFEDDVVSTFEFESKAAKMISELNGEWDLLFWGYICDRLSISTDLGISKAVTNFLEPLRPEDIEEFRNKRFRYGAFKLLNVWGTQAYTVSPRGAELLLDTVLPLKKRSIDFVQQGISFLDEGIDGAMNAAYRSMIAYACVPPLVVHVPPLNSESDRIAIDHERTESSH